MSITLRRGTAADAEVCGRICFEAFGAISRAHSFPPDFPDEGTASGLLAWCLSRPDVYSVVAELDGRVAGSNFLWENSAIAGVGPITVDPKVQNASVGRRMMEDVLARAGFGAAVEGGRHQKRFAGVRLVQAAFHNRSLSLYAKLGFEVREPLACMHGTPPRLKITGRSTRPAGERDLDACAALCERVHGFERRNELAAAISQGTATVAEHEGRITGYSTLIGFFGHLVGESNDDLKALIAAAKEISGPGMLVPTRNAELFRWCLSVGLRIVQPMTLMSVGLYSEPRGAWVPSILF
jgi:GNAT superfamily N-acetyltransferase